MPFSPLGAPATADEVRKRLAANLYDQLSEGDDETTANAITRAEIYVGAILRGLSVPFNLDNQAVREVVLLFSIYELHMALGHEEAGREYRAKAKDMILALWGDYPDTDNAKQAAAPAGAITKPKRARKYF